MTQSSRAASRNLQPIEVLSNKEDVRIIWLDSEIDDSENTNHMEDCLLGINPATQTYTDVTKCTNVIKSIQNEQTLLIVSYTSAEEILSNIHDLTSLHGVFILCDIDALDVGFRTKYSKIVDIVKDRNSLLTSVKNKLDILQKQLVGFNFFDQKQKSTRDLSKEWSSFMWHQLLVDVLKKMPHDENAKADMVRICKDYYKNDERKQIQEFDDSYKPEEAISWYTRECFVYKLLNRALRTEDIEMLYRFRFFIVDLCDQLKQKSEKLKVDKELPLFRGQQISNEEFKKLCQNNGGLISMNGFLSTSRSLKTAQRFLSRCDDRNDMTKCILEIIVDSSVKSIVFADIDKYSKVQGEEEVLFSLNATFKIGSPYKDEDLQVYKIPLRATDEGADYFEKYREAQTYEMKDYCPMVYFGRILWRDLGRTDRAKKYFDSLMKILPQDHPDIADVYNEVAPLWNEIGDLGKTLDFYQKAFDIREKTLEWNHPRILISLNNIGITYISMGKYDDALEYLCKSLAIHQKITRKPNQDWALRLLNIGAVHLTKTNYDRALKRCQQAHNIYKKVRPAEHRDIAWCLGAIGNVHFSKGDLNSALRYYLEQLEMNEKCLSVDHLHISVNIELIADVYSKRNNGDVQKALEFCQEKLATQKKDLGEDHPRVASTLMTIGKLRSEYRRSCLDEAFRILKKYTPKDDERTIQCLQQLGELNKKEKKYADALKHWKGILDIRYKIHSRDNPKIADTLKNIGDIYFKYFKDYSAACDYYSRSLAVYNENYEPEHEIIIQLKKKISLTRCTHSKLDIDAESYENVAENMTNEPLCFEPMIEIPTSTTLVSSRTLPSNNVLMHQTNIRPESQLCILL